jgi:hypothetical protein
MEVEIIKLPTFGSPLSIKTRKQGRRVSINTMLSDNHPPIKKRNKTHLEKSIMEYRGNDSFLKSIRSQMKTKGFYGLTRKQRLAAEKAFNAMGYKINGGVAKTELEKL